MKKILTISLLLLLNSFVFPQVFEAKSGVVSLNIKRTPPDSIPPSIFILSHQPFANFPIYCRDTVINISGRVEDNVKVTQITVNGTNANTFVNEKFSASVRLSPGKNTININAFDKQKNKGELTLIVMQDPNADIVPPVISLTEPVISRGIIVVRDPEKAFRVEGSVSDESSIYGLWINSTKIDSFNNGKFTREFAAKPDTLLITAVDNFGNVTTKLLRITRDFVTKDSLVGGKYYALIIGNEDYQDINIPDLDYPVSDSKEIIKVLEEKYTFNKNNIIFLQNPTRSKIIGTLNDLKKKIGADDNLLIFYAGHGIWDADLQQGFWLPSNAYSNDPTEWLSNSTIRDYIKGIKSKHTLLIADACFSGGIFKSRDIFSNAPVSIIETYKSLSRRAITSGALKSVPDKSVFVEYLIKRLKENNDTFLTAQQLFVSFKDAVVNNSPNQQTPIYGIIQESGDEGTGDFIFVMK